MADIRKRVGKKGTTYQVRYPNKAAKIGYTYETFDTLKEARAFREDSRARAHRADKALNSEVHSVSDGVKKWLDVCEKEGRGGRDPVTPYTLKTYRYRAEIIKAYDWPLDLHELTAPDVVEFRSWLLCNHSRDQARKVLSYFHSMMLEMVNRGVLAHDIAAGVRISSVSRYDEPVKIPTVREIQELLSAADRLANSKNAQIQRTWQRYRPMLDLAVDSGMLPQEYIVVPRFNLKETGVQVDRALDAGGREISVTKTPASRRFIDLSPDTLDMVRYYSEKLAAPSKFDLVFPTANGRWQSTNNWRRRGFQAACYNAGLVDVDEDETGKRIETPRYKPYDLRHFYASMLIEQRVSLKRIQKLMGHSDIHTTLNVYGHVIERAEADSPANPGILSALAGNPCGESVASAL